MTMKNDYFDFLCHVVDKENRHGILLQTLYRIDYYSLIPNDDNRGVDGQLLRESFVEEGRQTLSFCPTGPCKVLEMLIGLSIRLEFETSQSRWEKTIGEWFWILIDNLGLNGCRNKHEIMDKVGIMLERRYNEDGDGGLFPLKDPKKDQRRVEIWYQMSQYMLENYPIY